jgi:ParB family chromosome partitioning protein
MMLAEIRVDQIDPNPNQPRKLFDEEKLRELWASIERRGQLQPIRVQPIGERYMITAGERRWRAHRLGGAKTIRAEIEETDERERALNAIVENLQRQDVTPLEEAAAYQAMLDKGMTVDELATELGIKQSWRITERTALLRLEPEYQHLLRRGQLSPSQAYEMSRLPPSHQGALFKAIQQGQCPSYNALRAVSSALVEQASQVEMFSMTVPAAKQLPPPPSEDERAAATRFEQKVQKIVDMVAAGFDDGEIVALKKVNPGNAATTAEKLRLIRRHLEQLENALRVAAVQGDLLNAA